MTKVLSLILIIGLFEGCSKRVDMCTIVLHSPTEFYVDGRHCATNMLPSRKAMESGKAVVGIDIQDPSKLQVYSFIHFMWDVIGYPNGVIIFPDAKSLPFEAGPGSSKFPPSRRIAFTSAKMHFRQGELAVSLPSSELGEVCGMFLKCGDKNAEIELAFQGDRMMNDVIDFMKVAKDAGFKVVRICYYYGIVDDDECDFKDL
ncbi:MAG: hypothetical protein J5727_10075 [Kiritimatiellae bacterium]|nr:hypothetical protein [Kiritimatiellia bacterium]